MPAPGSEPSTYQLESNLSPTALFASDHLGLLIVSFVANSSRFKIVKRAGGRERGSIRDFRVPNSRTSECLTKSVEFYEKIYDGT